MRRPALVLFCGACALIVATSGLSTLAYAADTAAGPPLVRRTTDVALPVDTETLERQYRALSSMPSVEVVYSALGPVRTIRGATGVVLSRTTRDLKEGREAPEVLQKFKDVLLASGSETLKVRLNDLSPIGRTIRMDQFIAGIPVLYGAVSVGVDDATGLVNVLGATFLPDRGLPRQPKISAEDAAKRVEQLLVERDIAKAGSVKTSKPTLAYSGTHPDSKRGHLVWAVPAGFTPAGAGPRNGVFWIDAMDGAYVGKDALTKNLRIYSGNNAAPDEDDFPDNLTLLFDHPGSSTDSIVMNAYNNALDSLQAVQAVGGWVHNRQLGAVVHYAANSKEASHVRVDGVDYMLFGDGIPKQSMGPLGNSRDTVAHEYGHAMSTSWFAPFRGEPSDAQSGAISEAFSDITAALVDTHMRGGLPAPATWTIAEIWTNNLTKGLRSLSNPKSMEIASRDWFPARKTGPDEFTAHDNSSIMGHAFQLLANPPTGGFHVRAGQPILDGGVSGNIPSLFVPGLGPTKTWNIFFNTFRFGGLTAFATLPQVRDAAKATANSLYGPVDADAVDRAFLAVGVGNNCSVPPPEPRMEAVDRCPRWLLRWPAVPGATIYHAQATPQAWGWLTATTIIDGNATQCTQRVSTWTDARVRACNGCGCSNWSNVVTMFPWPQCP